MAISHGTSCRILNVLKLENGMASLCRTSSVMVTLACALLGSAAAMADSEQVLDSVDAFGPATLKPPSAVLEMGFGDPVPSVTPDPPRFRQFDVRTSTIVACQRGLDQGLYCLDGPRVRYWPDTDDVQTVGTSRVIPEFDLFSCEDPALNLDRRKPNPCTSLTVDFDGAIWLAGRKANSHSMIKVKRKTGASCDANWAELATPVQVAPDPAPAVPKFCAREITPGRPVLVDINPVDGEVAGGFPYGRGILGLEERKTVAFFPLSNVPVDAVPLGSGKTDWALIGNEQLLSAALLRFNATDDKSNFVLAATTGGRIMARNVDESGAVAYRVFQFAADRCTATGTDQFDVRVSSQSKRVYVSDKRCQRVYALTPSLQCANSPEGAEFCLVNAKETKPGSTIERNVILSTASSSVAVSPDGISVAPGIGVNLNDCGFNADGTRKTCPLNGNNTNGNSYVGAELSGVRLVDPSKSSMTVFQVRGVTDCRHWTDGPGCVEGLVDDKGYLNITPLLPEDVKIQAENALRAVGINTLPALLVSPRYRGQDRNRGKVDEFGNPLPYEPTIDLFFGVTENGVQFRDTFTASFDVADLAGPEWGCERGVPVTTANPDPDLKWDVALTISERAATVGGPFGYVSGPLKEHVSILVNAGCINPSQVEGPRWSLYAYNLEMNSPDSNDGSDDAVYAKLVRSLNNELWDAQQDTACTNVDGNAAAPIAQSTCTNLLEAKFRAAEEKLNRCISSSTFPRQSEAVNNCQSFQSQFSQYQSALNGITPDAANDPANRLGELKVRAKVLAFVFDYHFLPSIPPAGFKDCGGTGATDLTTECNVRAQ
jgi:hypothetical protein